MPFKKYLVEGLLPDDQREAARLKVKAYNYYIRTGSLYRKGKKGPSLKCLIESEF